MRSTTLPLLFALLAASPELAAQPPEPSPPAEWRYLRELRYQCAPGKTTGQIDYYVKMAEVDVRTKSGRMRWIDREAYGGLVIATIPAKTMAEFDSRPDSGPLFTSVYSPDEWRATVAAANGCLEREYSVFRAIRPDLSYNVASFTRSKARYTMYTNVWVKPGMGHVFARAAALQVAAAQKLRSAAVAIGTQKLVGEGPDFVFLTPVASFAELGALFLGRAAIGKALGPAEAETYTKLIAESVERTDSMLMQKASRDTFVP
jgi:hypothetical protein